MSHLFIPAENLHLHSVLRHQKIIGENMIFTMSHWELIQVLLYTRRRGTGYYKVPSLIGAWNRTGFLHSGYLATLEDMFDKRRLQNDYVPTGYKPASVKTMAVAGHKYGLDLNEEDKKALIAFIRSL
jgi:hypothetical protein